MPELTVTVRVPVPKQPTLAALERSIFRALMAAGRELLLEAFRSLEEAVLTGAKQRRRRRWLLTRFGQIRFQRWQTRTEEGYGYPLDRALGVEGKDPCSPWVRATAAWLARAHPYRQAARLLGKMIGTPSTTAGSGGGPRPRAGRRGTSSRPCGPPCSRMGRQRRLRAPRPRSSPPGRWNLHPFPGRAHRGQAGAVVDRSPPPQPHRQARPVPAPRQGLLRDHQGRRRLRPDLLRLGRPPGGDRLGRGGVLHLLWGGVAGRPAGGVDRPHRGAARSLPRQAPHLRGGPGPRSGGQVVGVGGRAQPGGR